METILIFVYFFVFITRDFNLFRGTFKDCVLSSQEMKILRNFSLSFLMLHAAYLKVHGIECINHKPCDIKQQ